ncbi:hypothetical protein [Phascolarctobacterium sp.]|uniref:hypothetical protein n=1 Tax=Phascolarctobacterium sp. TaxID=2049039 RepID=UPI0038662ECD
MVPTHMYDRIVDSYLNRECNNIIENLKTINIVPFEEEYYYITNVWDAYCFAKQYPLEEYVKYFGPIIGRKIGAYVQELPQEMMKICYYVKFADYNNIPKCRNEKDARLKLAVYLKKLVDAAADIASTPQPIPEETVKRIYDDITDSLIMALKATPAVFVSECNSSYEELCVEMQYGDGIKNEDLFYGSLREMAEAELSCELDRFPSENYKVEQALWLYAYHNGYNIDYDNYYNFCIEDDIVEYIIQMINKRAEDDEVKNPYDCDEIEDDMCDEDDEVQS